MASRRLDDLKESFRCKVFVFLARLVEKGIPVLIINTKRTMEEHNANVANGRSWTTRSKHCDGLAIDICPYDTFKLVGEDKLRWDANDPIWKKIGEIGEQCGLGWGGRWAHRDMGHFEEKEPIKHA